ncbi:MAG: homocysteine S-methyltransferase 3-like [Bacteroidetes bacterium]|nr:homocysteine S-methyltransferase 3-like [Bacteroidota bacterium]
MNTIREAYEACKAAKATELDVVVSFICNEAGDLLSGESVESAVKSVSELGPAALSINCVSPRHVSAGLKRLQRSTSLPIMVYGNVGLPESDKHGWEFTHDVAETEYAQHALRWRESGVSIIGGCCGTTPSYIRAVTKALDYAPVG